MILKNKLGWLILRRPIATIEGDKVTVKAKANGKGNLFAGIGGDELSILLKDQADVIIAPEYLIIDKPLKELGEQTIKVQMGDKTASFALSIEAE